MLIRVTSMVIEVEHSITATSQALQFLASNLQDRRLPNRQLAVQMLSWVDNVFNAEGQPDAPWPQLAKSTAMRFVTKTKRRGFHPILAVSGHLRASFSRIGYDNDSATIGSDVFYSIFHEYGTPRIPRRPMLPPPEQALKDAIDIYGLFIETEQKRAGL